MKKEAAPPSDDSAATVAVGGVEKVGGEWRLSERKCGSIEQCSGWSTRILGVVSSHGVCSKGMAVLQS